MPQVTIDGQTHDVDLDAITFADDETPQGFVSTAKVNEITQREKAKAKRSAKAELMQDPDHKAAVLDEFGIELRDDGTVKGAPKDAKALEAQWTAKHVAPLQARLDEATKAVETTRAKALQSQILAAATEAGVKPALLKPAPGTDRPVIVDMVQGAFAYDPDSDSFGVRDGDTIKYATGGRPFGASDYFSELRGQDDYSSYFASTAMSGPGHTPAPGQTATQTYTTAQIEAMSDTEYAANEPAILEAMNAGLIQ